MATPRLVVVGQDHDLLAGEGLRETRPPLTGTHRGGGCHQSQAATSVGVLLALDQQDHVIGRKEIGQVIEHRLDALQVPDPVALAVGPPLCKTLRVKADDLIQQPAVGIGVVVGRNNWPPFLRCGRAADSKPLGQVAFTATDVADVAVPCALAGVPASVGVHVRVAFDWAPKQHLIADAPPVRPCQDRL
jgi:hypothetical protein